MVGDRRADQIRRPLERLTHHGIEFVHDEVVEIDTERRVVRTRATNLDFDYLIVALGARTVPQSVEGFSQMACDLYSLEGCQETRKALDTFAGGKIGILVTSMPFKCPAAPYEAALLVESFLRARGVRDRSDIHLYTPEHQPMPVIEAALGQAIANMLQDRGIHFHPLFTFERMRPETREIFAADGQAEHVDLLLAVPPHQAPEVVRSSALVGVSGWIHVDPATLLTEHERVQAIGDITTVKLPSGSHCRRPECSRTTRPKSLRGRLRMRSAAGIGRPGSTDEGTAGSKSATGRRGSPAVSSTPTPSPESGWPRRATCGIGAKSPSRNGGFDAGSDAAAGTELEAPTTPPLEHPRAALVSSPTHSNPGAWFSRL